MAKNDIVPTLEWVFGIVFILYGLLSFTVSIIGALLLILGGVFILPAVRVDLLNKKLNLNIHGFVKWVVFIIIVGLGASVVNYLS
jgi:hypothetical protein